MDAFFCIPKASGGWRPVLNLSPLNVFLRKIPFKMETASSIREAVRPRDWATSVDLTDAYFHNTIHPRDRLWLRFVWKDAIYQFRALPFGLSLSPWIFTRVVREFLLMVRRQGIWIHAYPDDWLILNQLESLCQVHTQRVLAAVQDLGFHPNLKNQTWYQHRNSSS
jgi:hypothetical protein